MGGISLSEGIQATLIVGSQLITHIHGENEVNRTTRGLKLVCMIYYIFTLSFGIQNTY